VEIAAYFRGKVKAVKNVKEGRREEEIRLPEISPL